MNNCERISDLIHATAAIKAIKAIIKGSIQYDSNMFLQYIYTCLDREDSKNGFKIALSLLVQKLQPFHFLAFYWRYYFVKFSAAVVTARPRWLQHHEYLSDFQNLKDQRKEKERAFYTLQRQYTSCVDMSRALNGVRSLNWPHYASCRLQQLIKTDTIIKISEWSQYHMMPRKKSVPNMPLELLQLSQFWRQSTFQTFRNIPGGELRTALIGSCCNKSTPNA